MEILSNPIQINFLMGVSVPKLFPFLFSEPSFLIFSCVFSHPSTHSFQLSYSWFTLLYLLWDTTEWFNIVMEYIPFKDIKNHGYISLYCIWYPIIVLKLYISSVQSLSCVWLFVTPWTAAHQATLSITNSWSLLKLMSIESVMPSSHLILCQPLLLPPSILPSIRVFSNESVLCIRWPEYWSFSFNISPPNEHSGLISLRMDWLDLPAVQGTLKSFL